MGMQIHSGEYEINYSSASHLVCRMTMPWFDNIRDCDSDGYHQVSIDNQSVKNADAEVPMQGSEFIAWCDSQNLDRSQLRFNEADYQTAREFVASVAKTDKDVYVSF